LAFPALVQAATVTWSISISPAGSGTVTWATSSPVANGVLEKSGKIIADQGAFIDLTLNPAPGYYICEVLKNGEDITWWFYWNNHTTFGPVGNSHTISVTYDYIVPTGTFQIAYPNADIARLVAIYDLTGVHRGELTHSALRKGSRPYVVDLAVDETGKIEGLGTMAGVATDSGPDIPVAGQTGTVNGTPTVTGRGVFAGTLDGIPAAGSGAMVAPVVLNDVDDTQPGEQLGGTGDLSYKGTFQDTPLKGKDVPLTSEASAEDVQAFAAARQWSIAVTVQPAGDPDSPTLMGSAVLQLPNATIDFPPRAVKYTPKSG
jgi:hypothetical protein